jgi:hypothetical protein
VQSRPLPDASTEWKAVAAHKQVIVDWLGRKRPLRLRKIHTLLVRDHGLLASYDTLRRYAMEELDWQKKEPTILLEDPPAGQEAQVDFGKMGMMLDGATGRMRALWALIVTLSFSRYQFVWPTFLQTTEAVCEGLDRAWWFFGAMAKTIVPDNMSAIIKVPGALNPTLIASFLDYVHASGVRAASPLREVRRRARRGRVPERARVRRRRRRAYYTHAQEGHETGVAGARRRQSGAAGAAALRSSRATLRDPSGDPEEGGRLMSLSSSTVLNSELVLALKRLKLGRIADTLPERLVLADKQEMTFDDLLLLILTDEIARRDNTAADLRASEARLDPAMRLESWDKTSQVSFDKRMLAELTSLRFLEAHRHVVVLGPVGVGKTFVSQALGHIACRHGYHVRFTRADEMLRTLRHRRVARHVRRRPARAERRRPVQKRRLRLRHGRGVVSIQAQAEARFRRPSSDLPRP